MGPTWLQERSWSPAGLAQHVSSLSSLFSVNLLVSQGWIARESVHWGWPSPYLDFVPSSLWMSTESISNVIPLQDLLPIGDSLGPYNQEKRNILRNPGSLFVTISSKVLLSRSNQQNDFRSGNVGHHPSQLTGLTFHLSIIGMIIFVL